MSHFCHNNIQITKIFRGLQNKPHKSRSHRELVWLVGCLMSRDKPLQNWALWSAGTEAGSSTIAQNNHQQHSAGFLGLRPDHQLSEETPQRPTNTRKKVLHWGTFKKWEHYLSDKHSQATKGFSFQTIWKEKWGRTKEGRESVRMISRLRRGSHRGGGRLLEIALFLRLEKCGRRVCGRFPPLTRPGDQPRFLLFSVFGLGSRDKKVSLFINCVLDKMTSHHCRLSQRED